MGRASRLDVSTWIAAANAGVSSTARALYALLLTSADAWPCGCVARVAGRWADLLGVDATEALAALDELEAAELVAVDARTDEVFLPAWWRLNAVDHPYTTSSSRRPPMDLVIGVLSSRLRDIALGRG